MDQGGVTMARRQRETAEEKQRRKNAHTALDHYLDAAIALRKQKESGIHDIDKRADLARDAVNWHNIMEHEIVACVDG
jgi:hypothetical protein